ncbi:MAG: cardiolipin synthase, partial [Myxococcales bacterium]|nr:cardiolipin synthase [Myxococcales bacterium]
EYLGLDPSIGRWRDTHVQLEGPAVLALQKVFAEDWLHATGELLQDPGYYPNFEPAPGDCIVQVLDSGPDRRWSPIAYYQNHMFALARERLWITSPYFIPSPSLEEALVSAALRGVDVRLLVPAKSDHRLVTLASSSYYPNLIEAGIRIFEYERGFVHAKTTVVDDWVASVGSANMDLRSFHLNFELNAFVYGEAFVRDLAEQFERDLEHA